MIIICIIVIVIICSIISIIVLKKYLGTMSYLESHGIILIPVKVVKIAVNPGLGRKVEVDTTDVHFVNDIDVIGVKSQGGSSKVLGRGDLGHQVGGNRDVLGELQDLAHVLDNGVTIEEGYNRQRGDLRLGKGGLAHFFFSSSYSTPSLPLTPASVFF